MAEFFWYFVFYGFLGFLLETAFAWATGDPRPGRKCHCLLPVCPVYGLGAVLVLLLPPAVTSCPPLLFLAAGAVCSAAEYGADVFYERVARVRFWDYSGLPLELGGRVCLPFSLVWGGLCLGLVYGVHPLAAPLAAAIPPGVTLSFLLLYLADGSLSLFLLRREGSAGALRWQARLTALSAPPASRRSSSSEHSPQQRQ